MLENPDSYFFKIPILCKPNLLTFDTPKKTFEVDLMLKNNLPDDFNYTHLPRKYLVWIKWLSARIKNFLIL